jgi:hypothetical protein
MDMGSFPGLETVFKKDVFQSGVFLLSSLAAIATSY